MPHSSAGLERRSTKSEVERSNRSGGSIERVVFDKRIEGAFVERKFPAA